MDLAASTDAHIKSEENVDHAPASETKVSQEFQCKNPANIQLQPKNPRHLKLAIGFDPTDKRDPSRQAPPESPAMMSDNCKQLERRPRKFVH
jgi:hypothetical protein